VRNIPIPGGIYGCENPALNPSGNLKTHVLAGLEWNRRSPPVSILGLLLTVLCIPG